MVAFLNTLSNIFTLLFVVTSMLSMGLALTIPQILAPLRNGRLIVLALVANFVIVPAVAFLLSRVIPLNQDLQIGLILFGSAAGAPFLPKLAQIAKANVARGALDAPARGGSRRRARGTGARQHVRPEHHPEARHPGSCGGRSHGAPVVRARRAIRLA